MELCLWLDDYGDIYSDFDSRHYLKRRISDDFLNELKIAFRNRDAPVNDLILLLPEEKRREENEKVIPDSLKDHFLTQYRIHSDKCRIKLHKNIFFACTGVIAMAINIFISRYAEHSFLADVLKVLLEPAAWFFLWSSLDFLFYDFQEMKKERTFYRTLSELKIHFRTS